MVATVGSISIDLSTNTAKFTQGFKSSATTVEQQSKRMSNAVNGFAKASQAASGIMSGFVGGIVAGGALAAIGSLTGALAKARQSLSDFEEIGNRAKATGLSTDTFQAISHGAALADVEQESLNKSLEIFAKNAGLAKEGTGALYSGLIKLNPQLLQSVLHAKDQETRLKLVADAMAKMTDATDKAALATAVFGRGGAEMVRVLDKGGQSIDEMKRNAKDLGIIIPEDLIKRSGELDDKLTTLSTVINVNISAALAKAGPLLVAGAEGMVKIAQGVNEFSTAVEKFVNDPSFEKFLALGQAKIVKGGLADRMLQGFRENILPDLYSGEITPIDKKTSTFITAEIEGARRKLMEFELQVDRVNNLELDLSTKLTIENLKDASAALAKLKTEFDELYVTNQKRSALAKQFRDAENASMAGLGGGGGLKLPTVRYRDDQGPGGIDPETGEKIEEAIKKETEATYITGRYNRDAIGKLDANTAGYFDGLGSTLDSGFGRLVDSIDLLPGKYSLAMVNAMQSNRSSFSGGSTDSWAGRQFTIGGSGAGGGDGGNPLGAAGVAGFYSQMNTGDPASISGGGDTSPINVSVTVRPILEGQRLSGQSSAEIKQAASAGANTALRAFYGR